MKYRCPNDPQHNVFRKTVRETYHTLFNRQGKRLARRRESLALVAFVCTICGAGVIETKGDIRP